MFPDDVPAFPYGILVKGLQIYTIPVVVCRFRFFEDKLDHSLLMSGGEEIGQFPEILPVVDVAEESFTPAVHQENLMEIAYNPCGKILLHIRG